MFVIQVTLPWDFTDNWLVENQFQLNDFGFVDAFNIASDEEEERFRGAYAIRFPCDDVPGQTYKENEYGQFALTVNQQLLASDGEDPFWRRTVAFEFEVKDPEDLNTGNTLVWVIAILVVLGVVYTFVIM